MINIVNKDGAVIGYIQTLWVDHLTCKGICDKIAVRKQYFNRFQHIVASGDDIALYDIISKNGMNDVCIHNAFFDIAKYWVDSGDDWVRIYNVEFFYGQFVKKPLKSIPDDAGDGE